MKRAAVFLLIAIVGTGKLNAQGIKEWFSQKQTQTQYLIQQIAALKIYTGYLQKGYQIAKTGLNTIGDIKNGHFKLDQVFFDGLKAVNPKVKHYSRVADIINLHIQAVQLSGKALKAARSSELFSGDELEYAEKVFANNLSSCSELTDELITVLTPGELQLSDDERIKRIDGIYANMNDRYRFINMFYGDLQTLQLQRDKELRDVKAIQKMYGQ